MLSIPTEIKSQISAPPLTIPFTFIQTYKDNYLHPKVHKNTMNILKENPEFGYRMITDQDAEQLIIEHFGERELKAFHKLKNGSARGDFARYVAMYIYGGIYMDLDCSFEGKFLDNIDFRKDFVFMIDHGTSLVQCFFATKPRNQLLKLVLDACCVQIENRVPRIFKATGPSIFTYVIYCAVLGRAVLGQPVDYSRLPIVDGVLEVRNEQYKNGSIVKLYTINQINNKHYRKFRYKFKSYEDHMLYPFPDQKYKRGDMTNLYHED